MKNELLEEIWKVKDEIGKENGYDINKLAHLLRKKQNDRKAKTVNFTKKLKTIKV